MKLADLIAAETTLPIHAIMLLRHGNDTVAMLKKHGATIEELTEIQPVGSKYDYFHPRNPKVEVVVVIVEDHVYAVFRVVRIEQTGSNQELSSEQFRTFEAARGSTSRTCHRFRLQRLQSVATGEQVYGWDGRKTRTPIQRSSHSFFFNIEIGTVGMPLNRQQVLASFTNQLASSIKDSPTARVNRLMEASAIPVRITIVSTAFVRNPDVVAEVLFRAEGLCQRCKRPAPFRRRSDSTPYLEVHHIVRLADGGQDTLVNAIALCPNCHRHAHYGDA